jgi:Trk K+ transport system NAD-binding subunit
LFAIAWAVFLGTCSELLGFSKEVGAFLAGVSLASTDYRDSIGARLTSLRDFLLLFFFIDLGARLDWSTVGSQLVESLIFSLFVLIGNPIVVLIIMGLMGYRRRTAFLAGLTVAQISEFSLIVAALGMSLGHISIETVGLITLVGVVTIFISTYMILYSGPFYRLLAGPLKVFERKNPYREAAIDTPAKFATIDVILVGLDNYGSGLAEYLLRRKKTLLGVDFDPGVLEKWKKRGIPVFYGDVADPEMHVQLPLKRTRWVISTVRSKELNLALIQHMKNEGYEGKIALTAINEEEAGVFENAGSHLVFRPFTDATEQAADALAYAMDVLPDTVDWPVSFLDVRIRSDASVVGKTIEELPTGAMTGVSILAVSRGGHVHYDPDADYRIFPGDRLLIIGQPGELKEAERELNQIGLKEATKDPDRFDIAEIKVADDSKISGLSLAEIRFRQKYKVTLVGIRRGKDQLRIVKPTEQLQAGDNLIVVGTTATVKRLKELEPL